MAGLVDVDETFIGGLSKQIHAHKRGWKIDSKTGPAGKVAVVEISERTTDKAHSRVRAAAVHDRR